MNAMMIGFGRKPASTTPEKIGRRMIVTGVPARNAERSDDTPNVTKTAR